MNIYDYFRMNYQLNVVMRGNLTNNPLFYKEPVIGIIGGGIAGATVAQELNKKGAKVLLFEEGKSLVNGPPMCHLHAGGNLYREISNQQCITLLREAVDFIKLYPEAIDYRPTVIATPKTDEGSPNNLFPRLKLLQQEYKNLISQNIKNKVLGPAESYYKAFDKNKLLALKNKTALGTPHSFDEWMIPFAKNVDLEALKYPVIIVQEYGINIFRLAALTNLRLANSNKCILHTSTKITAIKRLDNGKWKISYQEHNSTKSYEVDFLVNACGFKTGTIDDMIGVHPKRMVEFKAAYISQWHNQNNTIWPEIIFHGKRGTPKGMAQLTPYPSGYFQLHGMTKNITLFNDGLASSKTKSSQPELPKYLLNKINNGWKTNDIFSRTEKAIEHITQYIPSFSLAEVGAKPLFGAQQIPGNNPDLRAAGVSFSKQNYACCEIVKATSSLTAAKEIVKQLDHLKIIDSKNTLSSKEHYFSEEEIAKKATYLAFERNFPIALSQLISPKNNISKISFHKETQLVT